MDFKKLYEDPKFSASFSGQERFYKALQQDNLSVNRNTVKKKLKAVDSYTLHKPTRKPALYRRIYTKGIDYLYQADLVDLSSLQGDNDGYKWIITIIDTFSKKA